jgi:hypothetical protein
MATQMLSRAVLDCGGVASDTAPLHQAYHPTFQMSKERWGIFSHVPGDGRWNFGCFRSSAV